MDGDSRLAVVAARILVGNGEHVDPACTEMAASPLPRRAGAPGPAVLGFVACGSGVRREAFLAVDGFDDVVFFAGEEERVAWDLAADGWHLAYVDDVVAHHHPSTSRSSEGWPGLAAVAWAVPRMRAALAHRRRVPDALERHLALLEAHGG